MEGRSKCIQWHVHGNPQPAVRNTPSKLIIQAKPIKDFEARPWRVIVPMGVNTHR